MASERRLEAIMFTDIAGYTRIAQADEALALELLEEHRRLLRPVFPLHGGTEVKTIGDAFLVEFRSALEALLCSVEIQQKMEERNLAVEPRRQLKLRIGVHLGDVIREGGDLYGDAVNVASRIEPLAPPGGICISQQVYDNIRNKTELGFTKLGNVELKNVELPMPVYRVELEMKSESVVHGAAPRERLAVLPFVNISPDPNDEYFADGLTEELITRLSDVKGLKVIARTSVMNYKKKEKTVSEIGKELDVGSIIEGSVRKAGNKIRVTVQLVDSRTEEHLWASHYDKEMDDIFQIQSDVAANVANSVSSGFFSNSKHEDTQDTEAYTEYLRATQLVHNGRDKALREALALLERAVSRDPKFARAYGAISQTWQGLAINGAEDFSVATAKAEDAARRAIQVAPDSAEGHAAMAGVANLLDKFDDVVREAEEAVRINPNLADAYYAMGVVTAAQGRLRQSLPSFEKAYELNPLSHRAGGHLAMVSLLAGEDKRALEIRERMLNLEPKDPRVIIGLAEYYLAKEDYKKAEELLNQASELDSEDTIVSIDLGILYARTGRREEAQAILKEMSDETQSARRNYGRLFLNAALGNLDEAFVTLDLMAENHAWPFLIGSLPIFAEMRKDPRFARFTEKVGLRLTQGQE